MQNVARTDLRQDTECVYCQTLYDCMVLQTAQQKQQQIQHQQQNIIPQLTNDSTPICWTSQQETQDNSSVILRSWINLDKHAQPFSFFPTSHRQNDPVSGTNYTTIWIPPGDCLLFYSNIARQANALQTVDNDAIAEQEPLMGVWTGFYISTTHESFYGDNHEEIVHQQGLPFLPNGQLPRMYDRKHETNVQLLQDWSSTMIRDMYKLKHSSSQRYICPPYMDIQLTEFDPYTPYFEEEKKLMRPTVLWRRYWNCFTGTLDHDEDDNQSYSDSLYSSSDEE